MIRASIAVRINLISKCLSREPRFGNRCWIHSTFDSKQSFKIWTRRRIGGNSLINLSNESHTLSKHQSVSVFSILNDII